MSDVRVVFHLHCYQPPRDDPWTGAVPVEPSAAPAHDWNQRVTDECYRPLRAARLLDARGDIVDAVNLYRDVSVDMGATLHRWVAVHAPDVDAAIRDGDRAAATRHAGHGSAVGQPYVHAILPLATPRDRTTLVRWGIADFRRRFGHDPEGMWLPETAVDVDTLECLAAEGVGFTILGQHQAARVRDADGAWVPADDALDPTRLYAARLPSGAVITVVFYDGALSHAIAFDRTLLDDGTRLAEAVAARARTATAPALLVLATDGETFGHHHRFGEMALARALHDLSEAPHTLVGGLGAFVAEHGSRPHELPEVEVTSPSAWSCAHGVERWRADCGDATGGEPHWNQRWRAPLRAMVDRLVERAAAVYEDAAGAIVDDPWAVRDGYGTVVDDDLATRQAFVRSVARDPGITDAGVARMLGLLELQRHTLFAQSSCAWFFADCAGIETAITLTHAARVVELVRDLCGVELDADIAAVLAPMRSNDPAAGGGTDLWRAAVGTAITPAHVAAGWAATDAVGAPVDRFGRLRVEPGPAGTDEAEPVVTVVDEATGTATTVVVTAHVDECTLTVVAAGRRFGLADLPRDARVRVLDTWWRDRRDAPGVPSVVEVEALVTATRAAGETPDGDVAGAVLLRVAPAVVHRAVDDPEGGLADLRFLTAEHPGPLPARIRWTAQNAVLSARDHVLPRMSGAAATDPGAAAWCADLAAVAATLGVALDPD